MLNTSCMCAATASCRSQSRSNQPSSISAQPTWTHVIGEGVGKAQVVGFGADFEQRGAEVRAAEIARRAVHRRACRPSAASVVPAKKWPRPTSKALCSSSGFRCPSIQPTNSPLLFVLDLVLGRNQFTGGAHQIWHVTHTTQRVTSSSASAIAAYARDHVPTTAAYAVRAVARMRRSPEGCGVAG